MGEEKEMKPVVHPIYIIRDLDDTFKCSFEEFSVKKICGTVPHVKDRSVLNELGNKNIKISHTMPDDMEIEQLTGAELVG